MPREAISPIAKTPKCIKSSKSFCWRGIYRWGLGRGLWGASWATPQFPPGPPTLRLSFLGVESLAQGLSPHTLGRCSGSSTPVPMASALLPVPSCMAFQSPGGKEPLQGGEGPASGWHPAGGGMGGVRRVRCKPQPDPRAASRPWPRAWYQGSAPGGPRSARRGPGSQPLIRQRPLSRKAFNVVRWYFSGCFSERKS